MAKKSRRRFIEENLSDAIFHNVNLTNARIRGAFLMNAEISGDIRGLKVNGIEIAPLIAAERKRLHPELAEFGFDTPEQVQASWAVIERLWKKTTRRAAKLPEATLRLSVDEEWSFVETLRHLIFATDAWASRTILDQATPYHRLGFTHTSYPPADAAALGIDLEARPTYAEVLRVRADRMAVVRGIVDDLTDTDLERQCRRSPAPGYPDEPRSVGRCLRVVMKEECEHRRYAVRDLAVLEAR